MVCLGTVLVAIGAHLLQTKLGVGNRRNHPVIIGVIITNLFSKDNIQP